VIVLSKGWRRSSGREKGRRCARAIELRSPLNQNQNREREETWVLRSAGRGNRRRRGKGAKKKNLRTMGKLTVGEQWTQGRGEEGAKEKP